MEKIYFHLLYGESGIGKTTLIKDLHSEVNNSAFHTVDQQIEEGSIYDALCLRESAPESHTIIEQISKLIFRQPVRLDSIEFTSSISTGEKQRLAFLRNSLGDRAVKIFDEPFAGVDSDAANLIIRSIKILPFFGKAHYIITGHNTSFENMNFTYKITKNSDKEKIIQLILVNIIKNI